MVDQQYNIILNKLATLCSQAEKSEYDALEYLQKKGLPPQQCHQALEYLVKNNYINNQRFAIAFARDKAIFNKWGISKITAALTQKKIEQQNIQNAINNLPIEQLNQIILTETTKKAKTIKDITQPQSKAKLLRFCAQRGYPIATSLTIIEQIINTQKPL